MVSHIDQHFEALDRPKSPSYTMDLSSPPFPYEAYHGLDYLQFPHSPFPVNAVPRKTSFTFAVSKLKSKPTLSTVPSSGSPRMSFDSLNLANGIAEYAYSSGSSYTTGSPARPFTPPDSICPPALTHLSGGELSDSIPHPGPTSRKNRSNSNAGTASPASSANVALPTSRSQHRFNPIQRATRKRRSPKDEFASEDEEEDFAPVASAATSDV